MVPFRRFHAGLLGLLLCGSLAACPKEAARSGRDAPLPRTPFSAQVVAVSDGDTVRVLHEGRRISVRLHGTDAPEKAQAFGLEAKRFVVARALGKKVQVLPQKRDRYGRLVAKVRVDGADLGESLIAAGLGWHYARYVKSERLAGLQRQARRNKLGLWASETPTPPWEWRRARRARGGAEANPPRTKGVVRFRGNTRSKIFHHESCSSFTCRNCKATFASASDAVAAGYRPHRRCVRHSLRVP